MTVRGKAWCLALVISICLWWVVIFAVKLTVASLMPFLIMLDGGSL